MLRFGGRNSILSGGMGNGKLEIGNRKWEIGNREWGMGNWDPIAIVWEMGIRFKISILIY